MIADSRLRNGLAVNVSPLQLSLAHGGKILEIKHIRSFLAVAKALNFSRAARTLHLSQPALSTQIKGLEAHLGVSLFMRNRRRVTLTPAGSVFQVDADALMQQLAEMELRVRRTSMGDIGNLRIGFVASATPGLVPAVVLAFKKQYPGVSLELKNVPTVQQVEGLRSGVIDAGFVRLPVTEADLSVSLVHREPFAMVLSKINPLTKKKDWGLEDLMGEPFIAYGERWAPAFYQRWTSICRAAGFTPNVVQETGEMDTAIALVAAGLGVAILPEGVTRRNRRILAVKVLSRQKIQSEIGVAVLADRQTPLVKRLIAIAKQVGQPKP
ncbi:LysR family transcriptional regulator [Granulicella aggregans]|uniref:LysR family transcriptional regulator n=1 Tax=Granulicella aggregans TaxID=474949 RepID=UPI0016213888|nr:LysR family transcriptional regulator [Granulicella aggregans]